jgi:hypothetical protein
MKRVGDDLNGLFIDKLLSVQIVFDLSIEENSIEGGENDLLYTT